MLGSTPADLEAGAEGEADAEPDSEGVEEETTDSGGGVLSSVVFLFTWWVRPLKRLIPGGQRSRPADTGPFAAHVTVRHWTPKSDGVAASPAIATALEQVVVSDAPLAPGAALHPAHTPPLASPLASPHAPPSHKPSPAAPFLDWQARHRPPQLPSERVGSRLEHLVLPAAAVNSAVMAPAADAPEVTSPPPSEMEMSPPRHRSPVRRGWVSWLFGGRSTAPLAEEETTEGEEDEEDEEDSAAEKPAALAQVDVEAGADQGASQSGATRDNGNGGVNGTAGAPVTAGPPVAGGVLLPSVDPRAMACSRRDEAVAPSGESGDSRQDGSGRSDDHSASASDDSGSDVSDGDAREAGNAESYHSSQQQMTPPHRHLANGRERVVTPRRSPHLNSREAEERLAMIRRRIARQCGERNGPQSDEDEEEGEEASGEEASGEEGSEEEGEESDRGERSRATALRPQSHPNNGPARAARGGGGAGDDESDGDGDGTFIKRDIRSDGCSEEHTDGSGGNTSDAASDGVASRKLQHRPLPSSRRRVHRSRADDSRASRSDSRTGGSSANSRTVSEEGSEEGEEYSDDGSGSSAEEDSRGRSRRRRSEAMRADDWRRREAANGAPPRRISVDSLREVRASRASSGGYSIRSEFDDEDPRRGAMRRRDGRGSEDARSSHDEAGSREGERPPSSLFGAGSMLSMLWGGGDDTPPSTPPNTPPVTNGHTANGHGAPPPGLVSRLWARGTAAASNAAPFQPVTVRDGSARDPAATEAELAALDCWSEEQVCEWLLASDPGFGVYVPSFRENHIDGRALGLLTREDLADLGVRSVGHRLAILRARAELHPHQK